MVFPGQTHVLVLIAHATSKDSREHVHTREHVHLYCIRAFPAGIHKIYRIIYKLTPEIVQLPACMFECRILAYAISIKIQSAGHFGLRCRSLQCWTVKMEVNITKSQM